MIPWGFFQPDSYGINANVLVAAKNVLPAVVQGARGPIPAYVPERTPVAVSDALASACVGLIAQRQNDGNVVEFAGTQTALYRFNPPSWVDVSRVSGGPYTTAAGERWRFAGFNPLILATNYNDVPQKYDTTLVTPKFTALGGSPPKARFIGIVRDQVVLAGLFGNENALQFSGYNNSELWTIGGAGGADIQYFPEGGPITGFVGGPVGHVFQNSRITRMTLSRSTTVYQFDEVQGGKGCVAPDSIVKVGDLVFFLAADGFYRLSISSGEVTPLGVNKWRKWFMNDLRAGTVTQIQGAFDPTNPVIKWAFVASSVSGSTLNRILNYDMSLDEATYEDISVEALAQWLTASVTLDTMTPYGTLDTLPFSLDSSFWKAGASLISSIDTNHKLNYFQGTPMAAEWVTSDGKLDRRAFISAVTPLIDTTATTIAVSMRERDGDAIAFPVQEVMEDTGKCSAWTSGNIARARIQTPAGANWSVMSGLTTDELEDAGVR